MAYKKTNFQTFAPRMSDGAGITMTCHREKTRYGFRHVCEVYGAGVMPFRVSQAYYNRTWERFEYETVVLKAIGRCAKMYRRELRQFVDDVATRVHERCEAQFAAFKTAYDAASPELKNALAKTELRSEADVDIVTAICKADALIRGALK